MMLKRTRTTGGMVAALAALTVVVSVPASTAGAQSHGPTRGSVAAVAPLVPTNTTIPFTRTAVLPNGRLVTPTGWLTNLGDFPLGVAVSPDGRLAVASNGGQGYGLNGGSGLYCSAQGTQNCTYNPPEPLLTATQGVSTTRTEDESLTVTDLRTGRAYEVKAVPTQYDPSGSPSFNYFYIGVAFSPDGQHLYASGGQNDAVYDFPVRRDVVAPRPVGAIALPDTVKNLPAQVPSYGSGNACTQGLAVTPDGRYLIVAHKFENTVNIIDTRTYANTQVVLSPAAPSGGAYPYGVVVSPVIGQADGAPTYTAYVSEEGTNSVAQLLVTGGSGVLQGTIAVGDHPTGLAMAPDGARVYVANADDDTLSVIGTALGTVDATLTLHALPGETLGSTPNAVAVSPDGQRVYVALAGDDAVAVLGTQAGFDSGAVGSGRRGTASPLAGSLVVGGMIPTGWYPSGVAVSPNGSTVYVASAKGLGSRYPDHPELGASVPENYYYDGNNMPGIMQAVAAPDKSALTTGLRTVQRDIAYASTADMTRGANNPIPATGIDASSPLSLTTQPATPIKYVIEVVRENRSFDQVLGDLAIDQGRNRPGTDTINGDPSLAILGRDHTPNAHALVGDPISATNPASFTAFATSDSFFSDGEASVQGHWWTAAANVNDYVEKTWRLYYGPRPTFNDTVSAVSSPHNCTIFQSALLRQAATAASTNPFTFRDYGELIGVASMSTPSAPPVSPGAPLSFQGACAALPDANFSLAASSQLSLTQDDRKTAQGFLSDVGLNLDGSQMVTSTGSLKNFSYVIMGEDHTNAFSGPLSPRAYIAQNDAGLGMLVAAISRSRYWKQTAILVMEDDSQDALDHVDGHRNELLVISPYAKHVGLDGKPGYVSHIHYSQASVLKTIELLLGLPYLSTYDQNAAPLYDLFQNKNDPSQLTAEDLNAYTVQPAPSFIDETYDQIRKRMGAAADVLAAESKHLDLSAPDRAGPMLEVINWQVERPDQAVPVRLLAELQAWNARHGIGKDGD